MRLTKTISDAYFLCVRAISVQLSKRALTRLSPLHETRMSSTHRMSVLLEKKRDGKELSTEEIRAFVEHVVKKTADECQIGAMLMAIYFQGMTRRETTDLTKAVIDSGERLVWDETWTVVDKHSTGGVGDKVSFPLTPALAAFGLKVPMLSGRGLEFTGGTLDKLESIPGFKINCSRKEMETALTNVGCFIAGATETIVPADKELYKRRDVTSTVASTPLIVASIISKKVAGGAKTLIMDMKIGEGAFCKTVKIGQDLAENLIAVSGSLGMTTKVVLTRMDTPIGYCIGNALEIAESIDCLKGSGPPDLVEVVSTLGGLILHLTKISTSVENGKTAICEVLNNGKALEYFRKMLVQQGVKEEHAQELCYGDPWKVLPSVPSSQVTRLKVTRTGIITKLNGMNIAIACCWMGAGRTIIDQQLDHQVGIRLLKVEGDRVLEGEPWVEVHHASTCLGLKVKEILEEAITIDDVNTTFVKQSRIITII